MSPNTRRLWTMLPIGVWVNRDEMRKKFGSKGFQLAITHLSGDHLIEFKWVEKDDRGLMLPEKRQYIRRRPIAEIQAVIADAISPKSKNYEKWLFKRLQVTCSIKQIKYANPFFYGGDGRKRKPDPKRIVDWDDDW